LMPTSSVLSLLVWPAISRLRGTPHLPRDPESAMLPRIRITDLLSEVARWTRFTECFTHLRTGENAADPQVLMASLLADGLNLGLTRMAEVCSIASLGQLAWTSDWHTRDETYALALRRLIGQQQREPLAVMFGGGSASSSDGQFFRAGGF